MKSTYWLVCVFLCVLSIAGVACGQGVGTSGAISGTVVDPSGAAVEKAAVRAVETAKGIQHNTVTDHSGQYRFSGLPPAAYSVTVEAPGFASEVQNTVVVTLGETASADFHLKVAPVSAQIEVVEVQAQPPAVDTQLSSQSNTLGQRYINELPIDRRDYLTFTLLLPGVSESNVIADSRNLREKQVPQSGLSFYGNNGRGNDITVDGGTFNGYSGFVIANVSQDAVQEFQINRSNYAASLGGASGASINIVTKSGGNKMHGTLYGFFRNDALDARDPFAFNQALAPGQPFSLNAQAQPVKNGLSRQQFGGAIGFPIKKDKTFFFAAYEGLLQNKEASLPLMLNSNIFGPSDAQAPILSGLAALGGTPVPCLTGQPALPASVCSGILQNVLTANPGSSPLKQFIVNQFEINGGLLPSPRQSHQFSGRLDHTFNDTNQGSLRYVFAHLSQSDPSIESLTGFSGAFSELTWTSSLQGSWLHTFNANTLNEFRTQWNINQYNFMPNEPGGPTVAVAGFGSFGRNLTLPNISTERDYEFADNFTHVYGKHMFQMGVKELLRGNRTSSATFLGGDFVFGNLPGGILSPCLQVPAACGLVGVSPAPINSIQSVSLGLPQAYIQSFGDPNVTTMMPWTSFYWQDQWSIRPNLILNYGLRYDIDQRSFINTDYNNFAPRASFAWDPFKDHKTAVRGGFGLYYAPVMLQVDTTTAALGNRNNSRLISAFIVPLNGVPGNPAVNSAAIFQTLFAQGKILCGQATCITPADLAPFGIAPSNTGPLPPLSFTQTTDSNFRSPYSEQASFGVERELSRGLSVSANYVYVHTLKLTRNIDKNLLPGAPVMTGVPGTNGLPFQNWGAPQCQVAVNNPCFVNPLVFNSNVFTSTAGALYHAGILELKKNFSHHFSILANYTYSKAMDDALDYSYWGSNQLNTAGERSLSSFDQRHKVVVASIIESPLSGRILSGFELAPVISYNSSRPFNLYTGTDTNGDHTSFADRPPGAGRNTGIGPNYVNLDMRLSWRFKFNEKAALQLMAEGFDIANRTNYSRVNDVVGATFAAPFNVQANDTLAPNQPLGYSSDFPKREIQMGARFTF
ncbi:MAG TPA: TonB-dependent receptor [Candidatus Angelobacter sp.]|jgi:hypothetical protein|nr:TonB-dependent receptor [Candidatus Angelobacter sp.]